MQNNLWCPLWWGVCFEKGVIFFCCVVGVGWVVVAVQHGNADGRCCPLSSTDGQSPPAAHRPVCGGRCLVARIKNNPVRAVDDRAPQRALRGGERQEEECLGHCICHVAYHNLMFGFYRNTLLLLLVKFFV